MINQNTNTAKCTKKSAENISIIIPANNEEHYIGRCLKSLLKQGVLPGKVQIIIAANGCNDRTVAVAQEFEARIKARGWHLLVLDIPLGNKANALNEADAATHGGIRIYLDADVTCDPELINLLHKTLAQDMPLYATGKLQVMEAQTWITRHYANLWARLPFMKNGAVGAGLFAVNSKGRARWAEFPDIISDDTFVRLQFAQKERIEVPAKYHWPMVEGYKNLVHVRHRQNTGVQEVYELFPDLRENEDKNALKISETAMLFVSAPISFIIYAMVAFAVSLKRRNTTWVRGR
ncbi:MAG: glycosyltransferase family 2 protein [Proteobacteria bacterium]|nr:glycosyltransferase family 2 protein [Pseudomonadota bacterium]